MWNSHMSSALLLLAMIRFPLNVRMPQYVTLFLQALAWTGVALSPLGAAQGGSQQQQQQQPGREADDEVCRCDDDDDDDDKVCI